MKKFFLCLLLIISTSILFAAKVGDLKELFYPAYIEVNGDEAFITEGSPPQFSIYVYSLTTNQIKLKFGKPGQGPGEFMGPPNNLGVTSDYILINSGPKYIWFARDGKVIKEKVITSAFRARPIKNNFVGWVQTPDPQTSQGVRTIYLLDSKYEKIKELYKVKVDVYMLRTIEEGTRFDMVRNYIETLVYDDKIFIADTVKGFFIQVLDADGNVLYNIDKNDQVKPVKMTEDFKTRRINAYKTAYRNIYARIRPGVIQFYDNFPPMRGFWIDSDKIYVITYNEKIDEKTKERTTELITLDLKGNILQRVFLPFKSLKDYVHFGEPEPYTIHKGILYQIFDNEKTETFELHAIDLNKLK